MIDRAGRCDGKTGLDIAKSKNDGKGNSVAVRLAELELAFEREERLIYAARVGDEALISQLLDDGTDPNQLTDSKIVIRSRFACCPSR